MFCKVLRIMPATSARFREVTQTPIKVRVGNPPPPPPTQPRSVNRIRITGDSNTATAHSDSSITRQQCAEEKKKDDVADSQPPVPSLSSICRVVPARWTGSPAFHPKIIPNRQPFPSVAGLYYLCSREHLYKEVALFIRYSFCLAPHQRTASTH